MANFPAFKASKYFDPMKPSYTSNEMTCAVHFDDNFENGFLCKPD